MYENAVHIYQNHPVSLIGVLAVPHSFMDIVKEDIQRAAVTEKGLPGQGELEQRIHCGDPLKRKEKFKMLAVAEFS